MTREEWDREVTARAAERVLGRTVNRSESGWYTIGSPRLLIGRARCRLPDDRWDPTRSISDAWKLVEAMEAEGFTDWTIAWDFVGFENPTTRSEGTWYLPPDKDSVPAPLAITLAALKAVGAEIPEEPTDG